MHDVLINHEKQEVEIIIFLHCIYNMSLRNIILSS